MNPNNRMHAKDGIAEVIWNYDAVSARIAFLHVVTHSGERTTLQVEYDPGRSQPFTVRHRNSGLSVRVDAA